MIITYLYKIVTSLPQSWITFQVAVVVVMLCKVHILKKNKSVTIYVNKTGAGFLLRYAYPYPVNILFSTRLVYIYSEKDSQFCEILDWLVWVPICAVYLHRIK